LLLDRTTLLTVFHSLLAIQGDPHDALQIAADVGSKQNFATHWGTWCMSDERWDDPIHDLASALKKESLPTDFLVTLPFGKTVLIPKR
jgi:N-acyl-phosphatidylethanolamine-hydrolysing phospholipase D